MGCFCLIILLNVDSTNHTLTKFHYKLYVHYQCYLSHIFTFMISFHFKVITDLLMIFVINVFRRQGCPHLGQGHGPIVSSRRLAVFLMTLYV